MNEKLYPIKFNTITDKESENYLIADLGFIDSKITNGWLENNSISELMDMYMDRIVGDQSYNRSGRQFPVCLKVLKIKDKTPIYVCPNDQIAEERYDSLGKKKLWYILDCKKDSEIILGFNTDISATDLYKKSQTTELSNYLNKAKLQKNNCYIIEPNTIHGICGEATILEVSESSALDFIIYNWGKECDITDNLSLAEALDFINLNKSKEIKSLSNFSSKENRDKLTDLIHRDKEFTINKIQLKDGIHIYAEKFDSYFIYYCLEGKAKIDIPALKEKYYISNGEAILIPADTKDFFLYPENKETKLIEVVSDFVEKACNCGPDCDCGCQEGGECHCDDHCSGGEEHNGECSCEHDCHCGSECGCESDCDCGPDCDCGCQEGGECHCNGNCR